MQCQSNPHESARMRLVRTKPRTNRRLARRRSQYPGITFPKNSGQDNPKASNSQSTKERDATGVNNMKWAYGVTTVPERIDDLLPRTLASLCKARFDKPRLFIDNCKDPSIYDRFDLERTVHYPKISIVGNWFLALWELHIRNPYADRYAIFQDDFVTYPNLKTYLEGCEYKERSYWNLYTFPKNEKLCGNTEGWHPSDQRGKGAVALVFDNKVVTTLMQSKNMVDKLSTRPRRIKGLDGAVIEAFRRLKHTEYVHLPSLVQHTGEKTTLENSRHPLANSFRGEDFDATKLIK